ncbi:MAG: HAD-IA family hydrolase [Acidobacteriota bacterium]|nr:HAD-IA family hydrolase [Acidobacteriota bacterium]
MSQNLLIFDMDGVLVDVTESYRETIQRTVEHFTGTRISRELIQDYKNRGGFNDDWKLSHQIVADVGGNTGYQDVVDYFQKIFHGNGFDGLILRERWLAADGLFERLAKSYTLSVFTGRLRWEAHVTLTRFAPDLFDPVIGADDVACTKPAPEGIVKIRAAVPHEQVWYIGDTVDDARCAGAAGVPFIGIASLASPRRPELIDLLRAEGAVAVIEDINQLEAAIANG